MFNSNKSFGRNSKKRQPNKLKPSVKRRNGNDTLTVMFPDGSIKVVRPDMSVFDGDWQKLALSLCEGHRVTWKIS